MTVDGEKFPKVPFFVYFNGAQKPLFFSIVLFIYATVNHAILFI